MAPPARGRSAVRALAHQDFRLFFAGQGISIIGTWIQSIAMGWLVYRLTGSPLMLGLVTFLSQAPVLVVAPVSGWLGDRFPRRRLLLITQASLLAQALALGALTLAGLATPALLLGMALLQGLLGGLDTPVRQSFLADMVPDKADLPNAIALNSFLMNGGRLMGPPVAGLLLAQLSEGVCFLVNSASYAAVIGAVLAMRRTTGGASRPGAGRASWGDTLRYCWRTPVVRRLLPLVMAASFFVSPYVTLMPAVARETFGGGPRTLGLLVGAAGLGGVTATAFLASRGGIEGLARFSRTACALAGASLLAFSQVSWLPLGVVLMLGVGAGIIGTASSVNMQIQTGVDERFRTRVVSLYVMGFLGLAPVGGLWAGLVASLAGTATTLAAGGALCLAVAAWGAWRGGAPLN
jgi:MFS family permease